MVIMLQFTIIWFPTAFYQGNHEIKKTILFHKVMFFFSSKVDSRCLKCTYLHNYYYMFVDQMKRGS